MNRHHLYRHFAADGTLLYIGISHNAFKRWDGHQYNPWYDEIAWMTIERFDSREAATNAERLAIIAEHPKHNIQVLQLIPRAQSRSEPVNPAQGMTSLQFAAALKELGFTRSFAAYLLEQSRSTISRWVQGSCTMPIAAAVIIRLLLAGKLTVKDIESVHE